jgi:hypothetical protein
VRGGGSSGESLYLNSVTVNDKFFEPIQGPKLERVTQALSFFTVALLISWLRSKFHWLSQV